MQGASPLASPRLNPGGTCSTCRCGKLNGGLASAALTEPAKQVPGGGAQGGGRPPTLPLRCSQGGLPSLSPAYPAFSLFVCPHPPYPLPGGKGGFLAFLCKGLRPLHPRGWAGRGTGSVSVGGARRGACLPCRLPILPLAYLSAPIPLPPFPAGRGRFLVFLCKGLRPLHPRGLDGARHWLGERWRCPVGGVPFWSPVRPAAMAPGGGLAFFVACLSCL